MLTFLDVTTELKLVIRLTSGMSVEDMRKKLKAHRVYHIIGGSKFINIISNTVSADGFVIEVKAISDLNNLIGFIIAVLKISEEKAINANREFVFFIKGQQGNGQQVNGQPVIS